MNTWYKNLNKSSITPPDYVFGPVWTFLYTLMFISLILIWRNTKCFPWCFALTIFSIQLFFNLIWTSLFFNYRKIRLALFDLFLIIIFAIATFYLFFNINKLASYLLIPYILWLCLAFYLNTFIYLNN